MAEEPGIAAFLVENPAIGQYDADAAGAALAAYARSERSGSLQYLITAFIQNFRGPVSKQLLGGSVPEANLSPERTAKAASAVPSISL